MFPKDIPVSQCTSVTADDKQTDGQTTRSSAWFLTPYTA